MTASAEACRAAMDRYDHREALARVWDLVRRANAYVDERAPWHLARAAEEGDASAAAALDTVLNLTLRASVRLAVLLLPFVPESARRILDALGATTRDPAAAVAADPAGRRIEKAPPLFPRLELT